MFCYSVLLLQFPPSPQQVGLPSPQVVTTVPYDFYKQPPRLPPPAMVNKQVQVSKCVFFMTFIIGTNGIFFINFDHTACHFLSY